MSVNSRCTYIFYAALAMRTASDRISHTENWSTTAMATATCAGTDTMGDVRLWDRYRQHLCRCDSIGLILDISRMGFGEDFFATMSGPIKRAFDEMADLESGAIANADESRRVGHYWLRTPELSPDAETRRAIEETLTAIRAFAADVHGGRIINPAGERFTHLLAVGIGGSALGPQFVTDALGGPSDRMQAFFLDNSDPDGIDRTLARIGDDLARTLVIVISKSGGTAETRNGMLEVKHRFRGAGLAFESNAIAITQEGSALDQLAVSGNWLRRFPMWDWVGGRTSELSAVGLLPAALQGYDIDAMLAGAADCDAVTRVANVAQNPAALLALMWHHAGEGRGAKDMVVLPYKDRLAMISRYLQQLVMESLGKRMDRDGREVHQGLAVYGNKGSTDQHAYVQQLRDGLNNFFVTFIEVLRDRDGDSIEVDADVMSGDYLHGFLLGTRQALFDAGRESMTITIDEVSPRTVGVLIALFERAVGLYASLINVNAYHQPGVEAGKKAAAVVTELKKQLIQAMRSTPDSALSADGWAERIGSPDQVENVYKILEHLSANTATGVRRHKSEAVLDSRFGLS